MKEIIKKRILQLIERNSNMDGIDISHAANLSIDQCYPILREMEEEGLIKRTSIGINYRYRIVNKLETL